jgi:hypothetical protein
VILRVKNWPDFQHYKLRKPPWIRLYRKLLDDLEWHRLPVASRALAPMLWLIASETMEGRIDGASEVLAFRLRMTTADFEEALKPLLSGGWFEECGPEKVLLAPCLQDAPSESEIRATESLTSNLTDAAREPSPERKRSGSRAPQPLSSKERMAEIARARHAKIAGNA